MVTLLVLSGVSEIAALLGGGIIGALWQMRQCPPQSAAAALLLGSAFLPSASAAAATAAATPSLVALGLFFLKVGSVLFGSGYVLIAFLQGGLVEQHRWLTQQQLLDAVAVGQFTPGPVLSTATFIGYQLARLPGAAVATVCIFAPSFVFVLLTNPLIPRLRQSAVAAAFLDAVNVSSIGLMAAVTVQLIGSTLNNAESCVIAVLSAVVLFRYPKLNSAWIVLGGALGGWLLRR